jgi:uncharacterized protein (DUF885 family)
MFTIVQLRWLRVTAALFTLSAAAAVPPPATQPLFHYDPRAEGWITPHGYDMPNVVQRYSTDLDTLERYYGGRASTERSDAEDQFAVTWLAILNPIPFEALDVDGRVDYLLLRAALERGQHDRKNLRKREAEMAPLVSFSDSIRSLDDELRRFDFIDGQDAASRVAAITTQIAKLTTDINSGQLKASGPAGRRAWRNIQALRKTLKEWFDFYNGYDPVFSWWTAEPWKRADAALEAYAALVNEKIAGIKPTDKDTIVGDPVGRDALIAALSAEMIPYTPEELIAVARKELAWCQAEMLANARELGYGDDWKKALEHVKNDYVKPGQQPALVRDLANEAVVYITQRNLITVPEAAEHSWRMIMMTPERQRINPFFTGGDVMSVSYPTAEMTEEQKLMSMRGNNIHFARATVFHELIPGHYLQEYMSSRYRPWRGVFDTPFWTEGWAFYWEMLLWDLDFPKTPEDRIGMLFWRMHRAARVIFSLSFHLGLMTAPQAVDFLVNDIGHERDNAMAEVRRSFEDESYGPLYQCAYEIGALQFRALHAQLVPAKMTERQFHDGVLKLNSIPVEMIKASLLGQKPAKDFQAAWKFYDEVPTGKHLTGKQTSAQSRAQ